MRALVICHEDTLGAGHVEDRLRQRGLDVTVLTLVPDATRPDRPADLPDGRNFDIVVSMGSAWSVYDDDTIGAWIHDEVAVLRDAHDAGRGVLGICFGGQALAAALGGEVTAADVTEMGWFEIEPTGDALPIPTGPWLEWHHDCFVPPAGAELLATTPEAPQLFRMGRSVGTQFHPEISPELMTGWLEMAPDDYLATHGQTRENLLSGVVEREASNRSNCYALVDWFLDEVASGEVVPRSTVDDAVSGS